MKQKKLVRFLTFLLIIFFIIDRYNYIQRRNILVEYSYQNINNISIILKNIEEELNGNTSDYSDSLCSLAIECTQLYLYLEEICQQPVFFKYKQVRGFSLLDIYVKRFVYEGNKEKIKSYSEIIEQLKYSLTDKKGNPRKFVFTSSFLNLYDKAGISIFYLGNDKY